MTNHKKLIGYHFEKLACQHLKTHGCKILHQNKTYRDSELDIIALDTDKVLIFVEVRYRTSNHFGSAAESITPTKIHRIKKAAQHFLQENTKYQHLICRFDVITFDGCADYTTEKKFTHLPPNWLQNAFY